VKTVIFPACFKIHVTTINVTIVSVLQKTTGGQSVSRQLKVTLVSL